MTVSRECPKCSGFGHPPESVARTCKLCDGEGSCEHDNCVRCGELVPVVRLDSDTERCEDCSDEVGSKFDGERI